MKRLLIVLSIIVGVVAVVAIVGYLLPATHTVTVSRTFDAPPPVIWDMITDVEAMPEWRRNLEGVTVTSQPGEPLAWRENWGRGDEIPFRVTEREEDRRLVVKIDSDDLPFGGSWTYDLEPLDGGSRLTITEEGEIFDPFFRVASRFFMDTAETMAAYLDDLADALDRSAAADNAITGSLDRLAAWMTGSFSSAAQAASDSDFYDIRLEMSPIWPDRDDGYWLYVEQATAARRDAPYRQRVYRVHEPEPGLYASDVYAFESPLQYAGAWRTPERFDGLVPANLTLLDGCTVFMEWEDGAFTGGTRGTGCDSSRRGAVYTTSEVTITSEGITSWDRGFDADGNQKWGAEKGPYIFRRKP